MTSENNQTEALLLRVAEGDRSALNFLIETYRSYLRQVIDLRLDPALRGRVDPSDVVQETQIVASKRIEDFIERRPTSFKLWLRGEAMQQVAAHYRRHARAKQRSVHRECSVSNASSAMIARRLVSPTPSRIVAQQEMVEKVKASIQDLPENDREILLLRYVEELDNSEAAELLGIDPDTARKRHGRALKRFMVHLAKTGLQDSQSGELS